MIEEVILKRFACSNPHFLQIRGIQLPVHSTLSTYLIALFVLDDFLFINLSCLVCIYLMRQLEAVQLEMVECRFGVRPSFVIPSSILLSVLKWMLLPADSCH